MRFNSRYGETFVVPEAAIPSRGQGARIMDLQLPTAKMSKSSESPLGVILVLDPPEVIERKVRRAVTDADTADDAVRYDPTNKPGVSNLLELLAIATARPPADVAEQYSRYGPLKDDTAAALIELLRPVQERYRDLSGDPGQVTKVLAQGAEKARSVAGATVARAREAMGLVPPT